MREKTRRRRGKLYEIEMVTIGGSGWRAGTGEGGRGGWTRRGDEEGLIQRDERGEHFIRDLVSYTYPAGSALGKALSNLVSDILRQYLPCTYDEARMHLLPVAVLTTTTTGTHNSNPMVQPTLT